MQRIILANDVLLPEVVRLLSEGDSVTFKAKGDSMLPFIVGDQDSVVLRHTEKVNVGDMAFAHLADGRYVLHRIVAIDGERVKLMGDGNLYGTEECPAHRIAGIAVKILRNGKHIDPASTCERCKAIVWNLLKPIRRYLLALYKRIN